MVQQGDPLSEGGESFSLGVLIRRDNLNVEARLAVLRVRGLDNLELHRGALASARRAHYTRTRQGPLGLTRGTQEVLLLCGTWVLRTDCQGRRPCRANYGGELLAAHVVDTEHLRPWAC